MHRRYTVSLPAFFAMTVLLMLAAARCGSDKKDSTPPPNTGNATSAPPDWDGTQDWSGSEWEVIEE